MANFWERLLLKKDGKLCVVEHNGEMQLAAHWFPSNSDIFDIDWNSLPSTLTLTVSGFSGNCSEMNGVHQLTKSGTNYLYNDPSGWLLSLSTQQFVWQILGRRSWNALGTWWDVRYYSRFLYLDDGSPASPLQVNRPMPRPPSGPWVAGFDFPPMDVAFSPSSFCVQQCSPGPPTGPTGVPCDGSGSITLSYP